MRKIIQLSDLHFGRTDNEIVGSLRALIATLSPDVLVVSGDLTQRAEEKEFLQAQEFLNSFDCPKIIVPGNHDIPFYNIWRRFRKPLLGFHKFINADDQPAYIDDEIAVIGLNTARSLVIKGGRVSRRQLILIGQKIEGLKDNVVKVIVTHHPLNRIRGLRSAFFIRQRILKFLMTLRADLFLAGHSHISYSESVVRRYKGQYHSALLVQAGTATSVRYRGQPNSFNEIVIDGPRVMVKTYSWDASRRQFVQVLAQTFEKSKTGWTHKAQ